MGSEIEVYENKIPCTNPTSTANFLNEDVMTDHNLNDNNGREKDENAQKFEEIPPFSKRQIVIAALLCMSTFSVSICFALVVPFFPEEAAKKGANEWMIGFIFSVYELASILSSSFYGKYIGPIGLKFMIISGNMSLASSTMIFGILNYSPKGLPFIVLCIVVRFFQGLSGSAVNTATFAVVAKQFPGRVTMVVGLLESSGGLAFIVGPVLGGLLYEAGGFVLPFLVSGIFGFLIGLLCAFFLISQPVDECNEKSTYWNLLKIPQVWVTTINIVVIGITMSFFDLTMAPRMDMFHINAAKKGLMMCSISLTYMLMGPIWGFVVDKMGCPQGVMAGGGIITGLGLLLLGPSPILQLNSTLWLMGIALGILGVGIGAQMIPSFTDILQSAKVNGFPDDTSTFGLVSGLLISCYPLGAFIGPSVGGFVVSAVGFYWSVTGLALINTFVTILFLFNIFLQRIKYNEGGDDSVHEDLISNENI